MGRRGIEMMGWMDGTNGCDGIFRGGLCVSCDSTCSIQCAVMQCVMESVFSASQVEDVNVVCLSRSRRGIDDSLSR